MFFWKCDCFNFLLLVKSTMFLFFRWHVGVIYWPSTEPSIKRCTCVNKRKKSGSRRTLENNITRCPGWFESLGDRMPAWEPACRLRAYLLFISIFFFFFLLCVSRFIFSLFIVLITISWKIYLLFLVLINIY